MGDPLVRLQREHEARRGLGAPLLDGLLGREPPERVVDLDRGQLRRVVVEHVVLLEVLGVEDALAPLVVGESRRAEVEATGHALHHGMRWANGSGSRPPRARSPRRGTTAAKRASALVVAHGAGAGMDHPFIAGFSEALAAAGVSALRFNFPYLEAGQEEPRLAEGRDRRGGRRGRCGHRSHRRPAGVRRRQELRRADGLDGRRRGHAGRRPGLPRVPAARAGQVRPAARRAPLRPEDPDALPPGHEGPVRRPRRARGRACASSGSARRTCRSRTPGTRSSDRARTRPRDNAAALVPFVVDFVKEHS